MATTKEDAIQEKRMLRNQGLVGYIIIDTRRDWDGHVYQRGARAMKACPKDHEVVVVRDNGECFHQLGGRPLRRVHRPDGTAMSVNLHRRERRQRARRASPARKPVAPSTAWQRAAEHRYGYLDR